MEVTFSQGYQDWLSYKRNQVKESTYLTCRFKVLKHLIPDLGNKNLLELLSFDMGNYIATKRNATNYSESTIKDSVLFLKSILKFLKKNIMFRLIWILPFVQQTM